MVINLDNIDYLMLDRNWRTNNVLQLIPEDSNDVEFGIYWRTEFGDEAHHVALSQGLNSLEMPR